MRQLKNTRTLLEGAAPALPVGAWTAGEPADTCSVIFCSDNTAFPKAQKEQKTPFQVSFHPSSSSRPVSCFKSSRAPALSSHEWGDGAAPAERPGRVVVWSAAVSAPPVRTAAPEPIVTASGLSAEEERAGEPGVAPGPRHRPPLLGPCRHHHPLPSTLRPRRRCCWCHLWRLLSEETGRCLAWGQRLQPLASWASH